MNTINLFVLWSLLQIRRKIHDPKEKNIQEKRKRN